MWIYYKNNSRNFETVDKKKAKEGGKALYISEEEKGKRKKKSQPGIVFWVLVEDTFSSPLCRCYAQKER